MITIIDYGMGNLRSVSKALEHLGATTRVSEKPSDVLESTKIILPGVGAFGDAMQELEKRDLVPAIQKKIKEKTKLLGICLGLQILFQSSDESNGVKGLGIFDGNVMRFQSNSDKVPHMGWNQVKLTQPNHPILQGVSDQSNFYFVHSYYRATENFKQTAASCHYANTDFVAMLGNENVFATQFHPEKSQASGLQILKNFINW